MQSSFKTNRVRVPSRRLRSLSMEALESRCLMAVASSDDWLDHKNGPLAKTGQATIELLQEYKQWQSLAAANSDARFTASANPLARIESNAVEMEIIVQKNFAATQQWLKNHGVVIGPSDPEHDVITGMVPLDMLETIARDARIDAMRIIDKPMTSGSTPLSTGVDGAIANVGSVQSQAAAGQNVPAARSAFGVNGAGVKVGVISDSVNRFQGGLADSQASGNLGAVQVLLDGPAGSTDEGRAMLELVKDIAPNSPLAFSSAFIGGQTGFAQSIDNLRKAGSKVIVDDITYFAEPMFQPGVIDSAIKRAVDANIPYFSSAGNSARNGIEQIVTGQWNLGADYDWNPGPGVDTKLRISIDRNTTFVFQWDDGYNGVAAPGKVKTDLDMVIYSTSGTELLRLDSNNIATGSPVEIFSGGPITIDVAVKRVAGPIPGRMKLVAFRGNLTSEYPISGTPTYGHNAGPWTIGVGAVPFYEAPPFSTTQPILTESFSSAGPATYTRDGVQQYRALNTPLTYLNPFVSGIDNVNTSFFFPGNDIPQDADTFPNFAGTSAAAPNVAAVAALMKQKFPTARVNQISQALADSARPVNGKADGVWDNRGGYGLVNALAAMNTLNSTVTGGQVIDNGDAAFAATSKWVSSSGAQRYGNDALQLAAGNTSEVAGYFYYYLPKGTYDLFARWLPAANRSTAVKYQIFDGDLAEGAVNVNQRVAPAGNAFAGLAWKKLKRIVVTQGSVLVSIAGTATGTVSVDAMRLAFVSSATTTTAASAAPAIASAAGVAASSSNAAESVTMQTLLKQAISPTVVTNTNASMLTSVTTATKPGSTTPAVRTSKAANSATEAVDAAFASGVELLVA